MQAVEQFEEGSLDSLVARAILVLNFLDAADMSALSAESRKLAGSSLADGEVGDAYVLWAMSVCEAVLDDRTCLSDHLVWIPEARREDSATRLTRALALSPTHVA